MAWSSAAAAMPCSAPTSWALRIAGRWNTGGPRAALPTERPTRDVFYKKGVTDAVADTVSFAAKDAGITADIKVSTGKRYYIKGKITKDDIELICERLLANRLVQDYYIT